MITPTNIAASTNQAQISVSWDPTSSLTFSNGGSAITAYNLQWDNGSGGSSWVDLLGPSPASTVVTFTVSTGVVSGTSYMFRVRAANVYGWGSFSETSTVKAAAKPAQILSVSTTIDESTGYLKISWLPPSSNGDSITGYKVEIFDVLITTAFEESTYCPGTSTTLLQNLYCLVPMEALVTTTGSRPYGYTVNSIVRVRISATNTYGYGTVSATNSVGARVRYVPSAPSTPTVGSIATDTQVTV